MTTYGYKIEGKFEANDSMEAWKMLTELIEHLEKYMPDHPKPRFRLLNAENTAVIIPKKVAFGIDEESKE